MFSSRLGIFISLLSVAAFAQTGFSQSAYYHQGYSGQQYAAPGYLTPNYSSRTYSQPGYSRPAYSQPTYSSYPRQTYLQHQYANRQHQPRPQSFSVQPLRNARPGQYYHWKRATGTAANGYMAPDGTCWKLMEADGIISIDEYGRRQRVAAGSSSHPRKYIWKIDRPKNSRRNVWIARHEATGSFSVLYRRPPITSKVEFYPATVQVEAGNRIVGLTWQTTPLWADAVDLVQRSRMPRLPGQSFKPTGRSFAAATQSDLIAARNALRPQRSLQTSQISRRPYDDTSASPEKLKQWRTTLERLRQ